MVNMNWRFYRNRYLTLFLVAVILGGAFRFYGLDWGRPSVFHPDEARVSYAIGDINRQISALRARIKRGEAVTVRDRIEAYNPHFFAYGSLPLYLIRSSHKLLNSIRISLNRPLNRFRLKSLKSPDLFVVGRAWSAFFDTLSIIIVFLLASRLFSRRAACLASLFLAFTVFHIQLSHFTTVDMMLASLVVVTVYFCARIMETGGLRDYGLAGLFAGLALATKFSAAPILLPILFAHFAFCWRQRRIFSIKQWGKLLFCLLAFSAFFIICEPFFLLDYKEFMRQLREQRNMVTGRWVPPWTYQYEYTVRVFYQLKNLVAYCMGTPLGIAVIGGFLYLFVRWIKKPNREVFLLLVWLLPVMAITVSFKVKFIRYFAPLIPFLCILGAQGICKIYEQARDRGWGIAVRVLVGLVLAFSIFYSLAYLNVYRHKDTRITASNWIYGNIPKGAKILGETWEFIGIPIGTSEGNPARFRYRTKQLDIYKQDTRGKARYLARELAEGDLIALPTRRMYGSVLRIPGRYPITSNYYRLLFEERLGFKLVKSVTSYPRLFGVSFNDDYADESFTVYDHPKVLLFQKVEDYTPEYIEQLLREEPKISYWPVLSDALGANEFNRESEELDKVEPCLEGYEPRDYSGLRAFIIWLVIAEIMGFLALPLTASFFRNLRDRGYPLAKVLAVALTGYIVWLSSSLGIAPFSRWLIIIALAVVFLLSLQRARGDCRWRALLRNNGRIIIISEAVFIGFFLLFLLFRLYNPDIFWSESSMDFSFINSILRSRYFPPIDPWASGIYLNYYYYGHYIVAMLTKLSGIPSYISYNLAYAMIPAFVISGIFCIVYNLTGKVRYGLLGGMFAGIIGNLDGLSLLIDTYAGKERVFRFFRCAHEVIKHTVHEFPFWSFIFVDLHAHVIAMPFALLLLALGLNIILNRRSGFGAMGSGAEGVGNFLITAIILGMMVPMNTWDFPTYLLVLAFMFFTGEIIARRRSRSGIPLSEYTIWESGDFVARVIRATLGFIQLWAGIGRLLKAVFKVVAVILLLAVTALVAYSPFFQFFGRKGMGIGVVDDLTTNPGSLLLFWGFFLFIIASYLYVELLLYINGRRGLLKRLSCVVLLLIAGLLPWLIFSFLGTRNYTSLSIALMLLFSGLIILRRDRSDRSATFCVILALYGLAIIAACELFHIRDFLQGGSHKRMNTIFKFYLPVWFFFSISAAYFVSKIFAHPPRDLWGPRWILSLLKRFVWCALFIILLAASLVFTVMAPRARTIGHDNYTRFSLVRTQGLMGRVLPKILSQPTLNGLAYMRMHRPDEYSAILWIDENIKGQPVIAEATRQDYRYEYGRISSNTGIPAVLGWWSHVDQRGYRYRNVRRRDVFKLYKSSNPLELSKIIDKYNIAYIYVGYTERRDYTPTQLEKFGKLGQLFHPVFKNGGVTIYQTRYFPQVVGEERVEEVTKDTTTAPLVVPKARMLAGARGEGPGEYSEPRGIAIDNKGNIYVADFRNYRIQKFDKEGVFLKSWGEEGDYLGHFKDLCGVAANGNGRVYVADTFNHRIQVFDGDGKLLFHIKSGLFAPRGIAVGRKGRIWVADSGNSVVKVFSKDGQMLKAIGGKGSGRGEFSAPNGLAVDSKGRVYVVDTGNQRVQILDEKGNYLNDFKVDGLLSGVFNEPYIDVDLNGDIYLTDPRGHRALKYSKKGELLGVLKPMSREKPLLQFPMGIAVDKGSETVYIVDCRNHMIRKFSKRDFK